MRDPSRAAPACVLLAVLLAGCAAGGPAPGDAPPEEVAAATDAWAWAERAAAPVVLAETAVASEGARMVIVGGWTAAGGGSPLAFLYDGEADAWTHLPPYPLAVHHAQAAMLNGTVYVFGGAVTTAPLPGSVAGVGPAGWPRTPASFKLAPGASAWAPIREMPDARALGGAAVVDGKVLLVGGVGLDGYLADVHAYDPATDAYAEAPPLPTVRDHLTVLAHEGKVYALAGRVRSSGGWDDLATAEALDVAAGTWTRLPDAPLGRGGQAGAVLPGGRLALVGGERLEGAFAVYDDAHAYDVAAGRWVALPRLPEPLHGMPAAGLDGGLVLAGGAAPDGGIRTATWRLAPAT